MNDKYRVGDRVRVLSGAYPMEKFPTGTIGTVTRVIENTTIMPYEVEWNNGSEKEKWGMNAVEIEPAFEGPGSEWWEIDTAVDQATLEALGLEARKFEVTTTKTYVRRATNV